MVEVSTSALVAFYPAVRPSCWKLPATRKSTFSRPPCALSGNCQLAGRIVAAQPAAQAIESGEEHAFRHVCLVEFVADFPLQLRGNDDSPTQSWMVVKPFFQVGTRVIHHRECGELVDDACVERRWIQKG